jgi:ferredoxin-NADP reductase
MKIGEGLRVRWPRNNFELAPAPAYHFLASSIGITPILAMIEAARARGVPWRLDYVGRSRDALAYIDRLQSHQQVQIHLTSENGRPALPELLARTSTDTPVYACGSQGFLTAVETEATNAGRAFHTEWFAPKPGARKGGKGSREAFAVRLERSNIEIEVMPGQTIIDACAEVGVSIPASCYEGTCGSCISTVLDGIPDHRDSVLSATQRGDNKMITPCVSKSKTGRLVLDW